MGVVTQIAQDFNDHIDFPGLSQIVCAPSSPPIVQPGKAPSRASSRHPALKGPQRLAGVGEQTGAANVIRIKEQIGIPMRTASPHTHPTR